MDSSDMIAAILSRRSIRKYTDKPVDTGSIMQILKSAQWAPSGLNNQPWRFMVISDRDIKNKLSETTKYSRIVKECACCIAVFYHIPSGYNRDKDLMSIGAAVQNMLLSVHAMGLGAVWLGEILNQKDRAHAILGTDPDNELMAVIAVGHPDEKGRSNRKDLDTLIIKKI